MSIYRNENIVCYVYPAGNLQRNACCIYVCQKWLNVIF